MYCNILCYNCIVWIYYPNEYNYTFGVVDEYFIYNHDGGLKYIIVGSIT